MREILFRGKRVDNGEWVYGFYALFSSNKGLKHGIYTGAENGCVIPYEVDTETVGQFTGLTDKNGKKIFEGDIFNILVGKRFERYAVRYDDETGVYEPFGKDECGFVPNTIEITDNIYDNKELIGK